MSFVDNPFILVDMNTAFDVIPDKHQTRAQRFNSYARIIMYSSIAAAIYKSDIKPLFVGGVFIAVIGFVYTKGQRLMQYPEIPVPNDTRQKSLTSLYDHRNPSYPAEYDMGYALRNPTPFGINDPRVVNSAQNRAYPGHDNYLLRMMTPIDMIPMALQAYPVTGQRKDAQYPTFHNTAGENGTMLGIGAPDQFRMLR